MIVKFITVLAFVFGLPSLLAVICLTITSIWVEEPPYEEQRTLKALVAYGLILIFCGAWLIARYLL